MNGTIVSGSNVYSREHEHGHSANRHINVAAMAVEIAPN